MSEDRHFNGRLDSWKEIAAYLNRDVRTVIRWEDKGLPVHRVPGGKRQAVFAFPEEIDYWLAGHAANAKSIREAEGQASSVITVVPEPKLAPVPVEIGHAKNERTRRNKRWVQLRNVTMVAVVVFTLIWGAEIVLVPSHTSATIHPLSLKQITDDGRIKSNLRTDGKNLYFTEAEGERSVLVWTPITGGPVRRIETPFSNLALQDVSSDGKTLLVTPYNGIAIEGPPWAIPIGGGAPRRLGDTICNFARWSPDNRTVACADKTSIMLMDSDGSNAVRVASFTQPISQIIWNPDGKHLLYALDDTGAHTSSQWEVAVGPNDSTGAPQRVELGPRCCPSWTWTRDGKTLLYNSLDLSWKGHLMMRSGDPPHTTELPVNIGVWEVAPGPQNNTAYLTIAGAYRGELLKLDDHQKVLQTFLPGVSGVFVSFSPDGKWITYANTEDLSLWRSRSDGSEALQIVKPPVQVQVSSWSPDGGQIAFMGQAPGKPFRIFLIGRDGGKMREASEGDDNQGGPSWSPDGKSIVYGNVFCEKTQNCWIRCIDLATGKVEILPGSNGLRTARWSPDGKYIAALRFETHELMLFNVAKRSWRVLADSVAGDNVNWSADSRFIFVDSPRDEKPIIEKIRIADGKRTTMVSLASLQDVPGTINPWVGLSPDNSPILSHIITSTDVYELRWTDR